MTPATRPDPGSSGRSDEPDQTRPVDPLHPSEQVPDEAVVNAPVGSPEVLAEHPGPGPYGLPPGQGWHGGPRRLSVRLGAWWVVALPALIGLWFLLVVDRLLVGGLLIGGALGLAAVLRAVLPEDKALGLRIRTRITDVVMYLVVGGMLVLAVELVLQRYSP